MSEPLDARRAAVLAAALPLAGEMGWTAGLLEAAAKAAGEAEGAAGVLFPDGISALLTFYSHGLDAAMSAQLAALPLEVMKIRERIKTGVRLRIEALAAHDEAARRAGVLLTLPPYAPLGLKLAYDTVDALWHAIGDKATDFNFYTKRAMAIGVYLATLAVWFRDKTPDKARAWAVLDKRIDNVMVIEGAKLQVRKLAAVLPSPFGLLGVLRYPDRGPGSRGPSSGH
jgi:ubiquinone biosynthesis protein COQ9